MISTLSDGRQLILASGSSYRHELLSRLKLPFITAAADISESAHPGEQGPDLALRLAQEKAHYVTSQHDHALIIGSDQVAVRQRNLLHKPGTMERARQQLLAASGQQVEFFTAICLLDSDSGREQVAVDCYSVKFRPLTSEQIDNYLDKERPFDCAGSFKAEGLGIALFDFLRGDDPSSLIGLPLIKLTRMLEQENISVL